MLVVSEPFFLPHRAQSVPSRQFRDASGVRWDVWDVHPKDATPGSYDRRSADRPEAMLDPLLEDGWLCFQTGVERRRFAPIPPNWFDLPDAVLRVMVDISSPVSPTPIPRPATPDNR